MRAAQAIFAAMVALAVGLPLAPPRADACTCAPPGGSDQQVREQIDAADAIVIGEISVDPRSGDGLSGAVVAVVDVDTQFKGSGAQQVTFRTSSSGASCGYEALYQPGRHLLVMHPSDDGLPRVGLCSSFPMPAADVGPPSYRSYIDALTRLAPPQPPDDAEVVELSDSPWWLWVSIAGVVAVVAGAAVVITRVSRPSD